MTNIITEIEGVFESEIAAIKSAVGKMESAVIAFAKAEERVAVAFFEDAIGRVTPMLTAIPSAQAKILQGLIQTAASELAAGDYTGIAQKVISQAVTAETAFIAQLGIEFVAAWAAIWAYNPASVGATVAA